MDAQTTFRGAEEQREDADQQERQADDHEFGDADIGHALLLSGPGRRRADRYCRVYTGWPDPVDSAPRTSAS